MNQQEADKLLEKYINGTASVAEKLMVDNWYQTQADKANLTDDDDFEHLADELWMGTQARAGLIPKVNPNRYWQRIAIAASVLLFVAVGFYFIKPKPANRFADQTAGIKPGGNKAYLTLSNGKTISLTDAAKGLINQQAGIAITKNADGEIIYTVDESTEKNNDLKDNIISTPKGGQWQVILPDGSKVWLNSASSLKYPASFASLTERRVELKGEAYFEIVHNSKIPFRVITGKQFVEDIGTQFNVNAYDAAIKTTLLEGSVRINNSRALIPGEQALLLNDVLKIDKADTEEAIAWKNGYFRFNNQTIHAVMAKLALWYDIDVNYQGKLPQVGFYGTISRNKNIGEVLTMLEQTQGVHFKIEGRRVTVLE